MASLNISRNGTIVLPAAVRARYHVTPQTTFRVIETKSGILLVPLSDAPMDAELAEELRQWQSVSAASWDQFPFEE